MQTLLLHVDQHPSLEAMLDATLLVAHRFGSHIEGVFLRAGVPRMLPMGPEGAALATADIVETVEREERQIAHRMQLRFQAFARDNGILIGDDIPPSREVSASWVELEASGDEALASRARAFDLTIVGRPASGPAGPRMSTLEAVLFESGRPALVVPATRPETLGETIVIGWNGSTETAHTLAAGMPFLTRAQDVLVLTVEEGMVPGPDGRDIVRSLIRNGVPARAKTISAGGRGAMVGQVMLDQCAEMGADLLFKGAYTQSRLRQMILGGATSHIMAAAELPVFMAH